MAAYKRQFSHEFASKPASHLKTFVSCHCGNAPYTGSAMSEVVQPLHLATQRYPLNILFVRSIFPVFVAAMVNPEHIEVRHRIAVAACHQGAVGCVLGYADLPPLLHIDFF